MTDPERLELARPREIGDLLRDSFQVYLRHLPTVFLISLAIVAPVQLIVSGIGLEELTAGYRENSTTAETLIPTLVSFLVIAPLMAAATIHMLQRLDAGERPRAGSALQAALDVFAPVFVAVVLTGLAVGAGLLLLVLPGVFLAVRLLFVPQAVVLDGARDVGALRASWEATAGFWWRAFAVVVLANLVAFLPGTLVLIPLEALAESADRQAIALAGMILTETLTAPFVALVSTLLFFDLRSRRRQASAGTAASRSDSS